MHRQFMQSQLEKERLEEVRKVKDKSASLGLRYRRSSLSLL